MAYIGTVLSIANEPLRLMNNHIITGVGTNGGSSLDHGGCEQILNWTATLDNAPGEGTLGEQHSRPVEGSG